MSCAGRHVGARSPACGCLPLRRTASAATFVVAPRSFVGSASSQTPCAPLSTPPPAVRAPRQCRPCRTWASSLMGAWSPVELIASWDTHRMFEGELEWTAAKSPLSCIESRSCPCDEHCQDGAKDSVRELDALTSSASILPWSGWRESRRVRRLSWTGTARRGPYRSTRSWKR